MADEEQEQIFFTIKQRTGQATVVASFNNYLNAVQDGEAWCKSGLTNTAYITQALTELKSEPSVAIKKFDK